MMALFETEEGGVFTALLHYPPPMGVTHPRSKRRFVLCCTTEGAEPLLYVETVEPSFQKRLTDFLGNRSSATPEGY